MNNNNGWSLTEKQKRYERHNGEDLIDDWGRRLTPDAYREVMFSHIEKYSRRLGEKDSVANEVGKMLDFMHRWHQQELKWVDEDDGNELFIDERGGTPTA